MSERLAIREPTFGARGMDDPARDIERTERVFHGRALGSPLTLRVVDAGPDIATAGWLAVQDEFDAVDRALSGFRVDSEITAIVRGRSTGRARKVGHRLRSALHTVDRANRITSGHFDPRIVGRLEDWGAGGAALGLTAQDDGLGATTRIVEIDRHGAVHLPYPVDLGGIGKGLALRWARDRLTRLGISRFLLDAGRDLVLRGRAPGVTPWRVAIEDPAGGEQPVAVLEPGSAAVATSSVRRHRWIDPGGRTRHHLVDPRTGESADGGLLAVTVGAPDPAWAEVWSKALFVSGRAEIAGLARSQGLAAWWVADDGTVEMTPGARQHTIWVAGEA